MTFERSTGEERFRRNFDDLFGAGPQAPAHDLCASDRQETRAHQSRLAGAVLAELDDLALTERPISRDEAELAEVELIAGGLLPEPLPEIVTEVESPEPIERNYTSPYDRLIAERVKLVERQKSSRAHSESAQAVIAAQLDRTNERIRIELEREGDDGWRKRRGVDAWRAGPGREEYNASRRKRAKPNKMTPKEILASETPEEKKARLRRADAERKRRARAAAKAAKAAAGESRT